MKKIMVIGYGAMAQYVINNLPSDVSLGYLLVKPEKVAHIQDTVGDCVHVMGSVAELTESPDLVVEMAGHNGLKQHIFDVLDKGLNIGVISTGAFTDRDFEAKVKSVAELNQCHVHILAGAIAGIDGLASAQLAGLAEVIYQGCKPSQGWKGSHAENLIDLDALTESTRFFRGTAREAASLFPKNANVAATVALAGIGMDDTIVELIADPNTECNQHRVIAKGAFGDFELSMASLPLANNPKTSMLAALSVLRYINTATSPFIL